MVRAVVGTFGLFVGGSVDKGQEPRMTKHETTGLGMSMTMLRRVGRHDFLLVGVVSA